MILNTGLTATYHSEYYGDFYNPLIGGFSNQNEFLVGGYPRIDLFINAKVQQTRLYLKAEHINSWLRMNASGRLNTCKSRGNRECLQSADDRRTGA